MQLLLWQATVRMLALLHPLVGTTTRLLKQTPLAQVATMVPKPTSTMAMVVVMGVERLVVTPLSCRSLLTWWQAAAPRRALLPTKVPLQHRLSQKKQSLMARWMWTMLHPVMGVRPTQKQVEALVLPRPQMPVPLMMPLPLTPHPLTALSPRQPAAKTAPLPLPRQMTRWPLLLVPRKMAQLRLRRKPLPTTRKTPRPVMLRRLRLPLPLRPSLNPPSRSTWTLRSPRRSGKLRSSRT